jgi:hypothetical protein
MDIEYKRWKEDHRPIWTARIVEIAGGNNESGREPATEIIVTEDGWLPLAVSNGISPGRYRIAQ